MKKIAHYITEYFSIEAVGMVKKLNLNEIYQDDNGDIYGKDYLNPNIHRIESVEWESIKKRVDDIIFFD